MLKRLLDVPGAYRFELVLTNRLPYEIRILVPDFTAVRANDVACTTQPVAFGPLRAGDIARLDVKGADRCEMGDLNKFSEPTASAWCASRCCPASRCASPRPRVDVT